MCIEIIVICLTYILIEVHLQNWKYLLILFIKFYEIIFYILKTFLIIILIEHLIEIHFIKILVTLFLNVLSMIKFHRFIKRWKLLLLLNILVVTWLFRNAFGFCQLKVILILLDIVTHIHGIQIHILHMNILMNLLLIIIAFNLNYLLLLGQIISNLLRMWIL